MGFWIVNSLQLLLFKNCCCCFEIHKYLIISLCFTRLSQNRVVREKNWNILSAIKFLKKNWVFVYLGVAWLKHAVYFLHSGEFFKSLPWLVGRQNMDLILVFHRGNSNNTWHPRGWVDFKNNQFQRLWHAIHCTLIGITWE